MLIRPILTNFLCFLTIVGNVQALDCASASKPTCSSNNDCSAVDNLQGLNPACGNLACVSGTCEFNAWVDSGSCVSSNFLTCGQDDSRCIKGPSELIYEAKCTGYANNECIYRWCPGDLISPTVPPPTTSPPPPPTTTVPPPPPTTPPPPPTTAPPPPTTVPPPPSPTPPTTVSTLETKVVENVEDTSWTTVVLSRTFANPIPICSVDYGGTSAPLVVRMTGVAPNSSSFQIRLQNPGDGSATTAKNVNCLVVEKGKWQMPDGRLLEAMSYTSTITDRKGSWKGETQIYGNSYLNPVVVGQVMTSNDSKWSVFWTSQPNSKNNPPSATGLATGKHVGEDTVTTRADETIGIVVMEKGFGTTSPSYEAGLSQDTVRGYGNSASGYSYTYSAAFLGTPAVKIVSQAAMDGGDGGWAVLTGSQTKTTLQIVIDEDQISDTDRSHSTEQVAYIVFEKEGTVELTAVGSTQPPPPPTTTPPPPPTTQPPPPPTTQPPPPPTTQPPPPTTQPPPLTTMPPPPPICSPCTQASDCHDPNNLVGLEQTCGNLACVAGTCQFEAWNDNGACGSNNFLECSGNDSRCTKGPADLKYEGKCNGFENNECVYTWCPGDLKPPPTSAPTSAPTVPLPPSTDPPEFTLDVTEGFAGQVITLTGFDFGLTQGKVKIGSRSCTILSWSRRLVKAYIADGASPGADGIVMETTDGRISLPQTFTVKPPSLVPTPEMLDAFAFMRDKMRNPAGGVYTAFLDSDDPDIVYLYGHHVTSEHMGLFLWVTAAILDHALFEQTYQYILTKMVNTNNYDIVVWGINKDTGMPFDIDGEYFNAPLDDFRVVKGLISGWMQWGDQRYLDLALRLGEGLRRTSVSGANAFPAYPDGLVTSGFGWNEAVPPNTYTETEIVPVDYADLWTMQFLAQYDPEWLPIIAENIKMMEDAQLPNGQYLNSLIQATQSFSGDFEYQDDPSRKNKIKTIQSLWIAIHLARVGRTVSAQKALNFYKTFYNTNGKRVPEYFNQDGSEASVPNTLVNGEVRIYAQLARLSYYLGDNAFGNELVQNKIYQDQERNISLETFGHLGKANGSIDPESFNTLEGLLAMAFELGSTVVGAPAPSLYPKLPAGIQWQWQLTQFVYPNDLVRNTTDEGSIQLYDIDLWSNTPETIANLKSRGKIVACYFEAGTWASWRAEPGGDYERAGASFLPEVIGKEYEPPYTNERWFNVAHPNVRDNIKKIMDYAKTKGCQYVEPDNVQGFERDSYCTGFESCESSCNGPDSSWRPELVCQADFDIWLDFNMFLAEEAHKRGMGVFLKNNWYQAGTLVNYHDAALTEQCFQYEKCWHLLPFLDANKAVLVAEYEISDAQMCSDAHQLSSNDLFSVIKKVPDLDFSRRGCCGATPCPQSSVPCGPSGCP